MNPEYSIIAALTFSVEADSDQLFMKMLRATQNQNLVLYPLVAALRFA
jgi:hypothetical protein